jgi:hypothetical protein
MTNQTYMDIENMFIDNIEDVPIIDIVRYSPDMPMDALMYRYYGGNPIDANGVDQTMQYLPLVLTFNNRPDISRINYGDLIKFPDIAALIVSILTLDLETSLPGVVTTQQNAAVTQNRTSSGNSTTAMPKIGVTLPQVNYDQTTGIITF